MAPVEGVRCPTQDASTQEVTEPVNGAFILRRNSNGLPCNCSTLYLRRGKGRKHAATPPLPFLSARAHRHPYLTFPSSFKAPFPPPEVPKGQAVLIPHLCTRWSLYCRNEGSTSYLPTTIYWEAVYVWQWRIKVLGRPC